MSREPAHQRSGASRGTFLCQIAAFSLSGFFVHSWTHSYGFESLLDGQWGQTMREVGVPSSQDREQATN